MPSPASTGLCSAMGLRLFAIGWILTAITNFPSGFTHTSVNTAVAQMNSYLNESFTERYRPLDHHEVSLIKSGINSVWYAGQVIGAVLSPVICDRYGRKVAYIISVVVMAAACGMQMAASFTPLAEVLVLGRIITAIFSPLSDAALILYLQEISPAALRGTMSSLYSTGYATMCLFGMLLGDERVLGHSLSALLFVPVIPGVLSTIFMLWVPETPKFLIITRNDKVAALKSLHFYQGAEADESQLLCDEGGATNSSGFVEKNGTLALLRQRHLLRAFFLSVSVLVLTLPFYPILQSSTFFFTQLHIPNEVAQLSSSLLMVLLVCCCIVSTLVVDKVPRRVLLLSGGTSCVFALCVFVLAAEMGFKYLALSAVFGFVFAYGLGVGPVAWFICPELVPLQHRSVMFCLCYAVHSCLVVVTNFAAIPLFISTGALCFVPIFILPLSLALLFVWLFLPETKGRETSEIVALLRGKSAVAPC